ncbi:MAG: acyl carrier protein [Hyphomicrobiales bacterium]|nr:acyl carrier protein [Hyphomicrobiales bacterium]
MHDDIETKVRQFIADNFLFREDRHSLCETESLLESGLMDSTGVLELVAFLECDIGIEINDADIVPENLDSVQNITNFAKSRTLKAA